MLVIIPILVFISVVLVILAFGSPQLETMEGRLEKHGYGLASHRVRDLSTPFSQRVIVPFLRNLAKLGAALAPGNINEQTEERLTLAGNSYGLRAAQFLTAAIVTGFVLPLLYLGLVRIVIGRPTELKDAIIALAIFAFGIYLLPRLWLSLKISARQNKIEKSLPDALDLITISVEAGLTLEAALARVVSRTKGPLSDEFERALQEVSVGKARARALRDITKRTGVADLQSVIAALVQAEETGASIANVLRVQSDSVRVKRRQRAQERAMQAPVKMLFPLIFFILPAMFVVILGPAVIRIANVLFTTLK